MQKLQCLLFVVGWSYICCYINCMTVPLSAGLEFAKGISILVKSVVAKHFLNNCTGITKRENMEVQVIEELKEGNYDLIVKPWSREKYWQAQLLTLTRDMNSTWY